MEQQTNQVKGPWRTAAEPEESRLDVAGYRNDVTYSGGHDEVHERLARGLCDLGVLEDESYVVHFRERLADDVCMEAHHEDEQRAPRCKIAAFVEVG